MPPQLLPVGMGSRRNKSDVFWEGKGERVGAALGVFLPNFQLCKRCWQG